MSTLKTRIAQLEKSRAPEDDSWPLVVLPGELTPEREQEIAEAEARGRHVLRVTFIDANL